MTLEPTSEPDPDPGRFSEKKAFRYPLDAAGKKSKGAYSISHNSQPSINFN